ncbi:MAG: hypothetical protein RMI93_04390 [Caldimicrobium sp.]|nr:hypothetical protein [Caldimicrobium sp.]MDW8182826.1 hypothetical protein [Caldimicrobium sp.]
MALRLIDICLIFADVFDSTGVPEPVSLISLFGNPFAWRCLT